MAYFLIAVSNHENLELCLRYSLAGFTSSANGLWAFSDIQQGDFVSFLYGARVFNLYAVESKLAYREAEKLPPWPPVTFRLSRRTYYFPFRLKLKQVRTFNETLVRAEFAYVAENLLLRGGYRKSHFQADQTTLHAVSELVRPYSGQPETLLLEGSATFEPCLTFQSVNVSLPETTLFREVFLQALVRRYLASELRLGEFLELAGISGVDPSDLEVLSEKALPEGHMDLLIKDASPRGLSRKIPIEVKKGAATARDLTQLHGYMESIGEECLGGVVVAGSASSRVGSAAAENRISVLAYSIDRSRDPSSFEELSTSFRIFS